MTAAKTSVIPILNFHKRYSGTFFKKQRDVKNISSYIHFNKLKITYTHNPPVVNHDASLAPTWKTVLSGTSPKHAPNRCSRQLRGQCARFSGELFLFPRPDVSDLRAGKSGSIAHAEECRRNSGHEFTKFRTSGGTLIHLHFSTACTISPTLHSSTNKFRHAVRLTSVWHVS